MSIKLVVLALAAFAAAAPRAAPQLLDLDFIAAQGPAPTPTIAIGVASQVITFDATAAASAAAAAVIQAADTDSTVAVAVGKRGLIAARSNCLPLTPGSGAHPADDTPSGWLAMPDWASAANAAPAVSGYTTAFVNQQGANNANGFVASSQYNHKGSEF